MSNEVKESDEKSRRLRERFSLALPVRIHCRESADYEWHEMSHLVDVTPFGARLRLKRPTEEGRLLLLALEWTVHEESDEVLSEVDISDKRKETRHSIPIEITIEVFAENGDFAESESTVTENISPIGASVFTTLNLEVGRFVRVSSQQSDAAVVAVVRTRRVGPEGVARLICNSLVVNGHFDTFK